MSSSVMWNPKFSC